MSFGGGGFGGGGFGGGGGAPNYGAYNAGGAGGVGGGGAPNYGGYSGGGGAPAGGFIEPTPFTPNDDTTPGGSKRTNSSSLIPVTIKQLMQAEKQPDETFQIDGVELNQVSLVGVIMDVNTLSTSVNYAIEDGTGRIDTKFWIENNESEASSNRRTSWREGVYVRVIGQLRSFNETRNLTAFRIQPVEDFNQVTYHLLDVIYAHLHNTRGPIGGGGGVKSESTTTTSVAPAGPYGALPAGGNVAPLAADDPYAALTPCQRSVIEVINSSTNEEGASISEMVSRFAGSFSEGDIREAVDFLQSEVFCYSTIDDNHFRSTKEDP